MCLSTVPKWPTLSLTIRDSDTFILPPLPDSLSHDSDSLSLDSDSLSLDSDSPSDDSDSLSLDSANSPFKRSVAMNACIFMRARMAYNRRWDGS